MLGLASAATSGRGLGQSADVAEMNRFVVAAGHGARFAGRAGALRIFRAPAKRAARKARLMGAWERPSPREAVSPFAKPLQSALLSRLISEVMTSQ